MNMKKPRNLLISKMIDKEIRGEQVITQLKLSLNKKKIFRITAAKTKEKETIVRYLISPSCDKIIIISKVWGFGVLGGSSDI